ncbi:MAG: AAA family ATPase [Pseudomonadota bacterium]
MKLVRFRNPFGPSDAADPALFSGRVAEMTAIARMLSAAYHSDPAQHLLVLGERGIGKTSLLRQCERMATDDLPGERTDFDFLVVSITLTGVTDMFDITQRTADGLRRALDRGKVGNPGLRQVVDFLLNWEILGVHYHRPAGAATHDQALSTLVDKIVEVERTGLFQGLFLSIDEADAPGAEVGLGPWCKDLCERLGQAGGRKTALALAGRSLLRNRLREGHGASLRLFDELELTVLSPDERRDIIDKGIRLANLSNDTPVTIAPKARDLIADLSEGYPYFLQTFAHAALEAAAGGGEITLEHVVTSASQATRDIGRKFFDGVFQEAATTENYRMVLYAMADAGNSWMTRKEITAAAAPDVSPDNVSNALRKMKHTDALDIDPDRPGVYRLPTRAFASWLTLMREDAIADASAGGQD